METEEQVKAVEAKRQKSFWFADWSFPLIVGIMSAAVFSGTHMYVVYGVGAFNEVSDRCDAKSRLGWRFLWGCGSFWGEFLIC